jgi:hypothetical protein
VDLEQEATVRRPEWAVINAGRTAGVGAGAIGPKSQPLPLIPHDEVSRQQEHLLPVVVHKRKSGVGAGLKPQQSRPIADLGILVERAREDLLLNAGRIAQAFASWVARGV